MMLRLVLLPVLAVLLVSGCACGRAPVVELGPKHIKGGVAYGARVTRFADLPIDAQVNVIEGRGAAVLLAPREGTGIGSETHEVWQVVACPDCGPRITEVTVHLHRELRYDADGTRLLEVAEARTEVDPARLVALDVTASVGCGTGPSMTNEVTTAMPSPYPARCPDCAGPLGAPPGRDAGPWWRQARRPASWYRALAAAHPGSAAVQAYCGAAHRIDGRLAEAVACFRACLAASPDGPLAAEARQEVAYWSKQLEGR